MRCKFFNTEKVSVFVLCLLFVFSLTLSLLLHANPADYNTEATVSTGKRITTVVIDAGHGGEDVGAIGIGNIYEKDLNMQISLKLGEYLNSAGLEVVYTRTEDRLLYTEEQNIKGMRKINDLKNRVAIANSYENSILVSVHMNSFGQASCSGLQIYHSDDVLSEKLASSVQNSVKSLLQPANKRQTKIGKDIYILENSTVPAILIECGFISNPEECKKLSEKEYQKELCFAILCGIIEYNKERN